jgi:hypothetical protein
MAVEGSQARAQQVVVVVVVVVVLVESRTWPRAPRRDE